MRRISQPYRKKEPVVCQRNHEAKVGRGLDAQAIYPPKTGRGVAAIRPAAKSETKWAISWDMRNAVEAEAVRAVAVAAKVVKAGARSK